MFTLAVALAEEGVDVTVGIPPVGERYRPHIDRVRDAGVPVLTAKGPLTPGPQGLLLSGLRRRAAANARALIEATGSSVILVNLPTVERGAAIVDAAHDAAGDQIIVGGYVHLGQLPSVIGARRFARLRDRLAPRNVRRFDLLLGVCRATSAQLASYGFRGRLDTAYPGSLAVRAGAQADQAEARQRLGLEANRLIGLIGRVAFHQKGHDIAVRVARGLEQRGTEATWVVVGDGPDLQRLRELVEANGLSRRFRWIAWIPDAPEIMPAFDLVAMPSLFEGMPLTAVEAIVSRVPVVAFAVDGLAELLAAPFAVPPSDAEAFADAVAGVLADPTSWPGEERAAIASRLCDPAAVARRVIAAFKLTDNDA